MKRTPTRNRRVRIQVNDNDGYPQKTYRPHAACRRAAAFRFGFPEPLREHDDPHGRAARFAAPGHREHDARQFFDQPAAREPREDLHRVRRVRAAQGSAKGVLHLAADEEETARFAARTGGRHPVARHARGEYDLCAQLRQRHPRQQRGQPALLDALCLLDGARDRLDGHVGLYGRQL